LNNGQALKVVEEDLQVFKQLLNIGLENIQLAQQRQLGPWLLKYNQLRSFRPRRISQQVFTGLEKQLNRDGFHFNKPFMAKECFWSGELLNKPVDLFYNKFPFADCHGLLVIDRQSWQPQYLTQAIHDYMFALSQQLGEKLTDVGFGYNSIGAFASVNHLHFQMFLGADSCGVTQPQWQHKGGEQIYPATCQFETDVARAWQSIQHFHQQQQPYNLLYTAEGVYLFARPEQNQVPVPAWSSGCTWYELSGALVVFDPDAYQKLSSEDIRHELSLLAVNG